MGAVLSNLAALHRAALTREICQPFYMFAEPNSASAEVKIEKEIAGVKNHKERLTDKVYA